MLRKIIICMWIVFVTILETSIQGNAWNLPYDVDIVSIQFNFTSGTDDAMNVYNEGSLVTDPEWYQSGGTSTNLGFAYLNSVTSPQVHAMFYTSTLSTIPPSMRIQAYTSVGPTFWQLAEKEVFNCNFDSSGFSSPITFNTAQGWGLPTGAVGKFQTNWAWQITTSFGEPEVPFKSIGTTSHTYYKPLSTPLSPMNYPWLEVLDKACTWANGATSQSSIATAIVHGVYNHLGDQDGDLDYDVANHFTVGDSGFDLTAFFDSLAVSSNVWVNCTDCANLFSIYSRVLGCDSKMKNYLKQGCHYTQKALTQSEISLVGGLLTGVITRSVG